MLIFWPDSSLTTPCGYKKSAVVTTGNTHQPACTSAAAIAANIPHNAGVLLSKTTIITLLKQKGLRHMSPRVMTPFTAKHKASRVQLAKTVVRRELVLWRRVMISDSEYFLLQSKGRPAGRWCTAKTRGSVVRAKHSAWGPCLHEHHPPGHSKTGVCVRRTQGQICKYLDLKTKRPLRAMRRQEYGIGVFNLKPEGDRLFQQMWSKSWQLQQDKATLHTTAWP